ncbi:MAG TPA: GntR family transcriptional regulator [Chloroflexota bacterium]|nr:GntR family transcriptional regulator [Chloroflexota bacterium]
MVVDVGEEAAASSRFERAYRCLRDSITDGTYRPNQRLTETDLASALGVSRPTVRAILVRLEQEGLVVLEPNRGASVRSFDIADAVRTLRLREVLEGLSAALAAELATPEEVDAMSEVLLEMEEKVEATDLLGYSSLNAKLHRTILNAARDEQLRKVLWSLHYALIRYQYRTVLVPGRKDDSLSEHRQIVERIRAHDSAGAEAAMRRHVGHVRETLQASAELLA